MSEIPKLEKGISAEVSEEVRTILLEIESTKEKLKQVDAEINDIRNDIIRESHEESEELQPLYDRLDMLDTTDPATDTEYEKLQSEWDLVRTRRRKEQLALEDRLNKFRDTRHVLKRNTEDLQLQYRQAAFGSSQHAH